MKKMLALLTSVALSISLLAACSGTAASEAAPASGDAAGGDAAASTAGGADDGAISVAMVLTGPINDAGWNESAYNGLMMAQEEYGIETAYSENVPQPDFETVLRDYAANGYDVIIAHGFEFSDPAKAVAPEFPDSMFCVVNGDSMQEPNVLALRSNTPETGFLAGAAAALASESGVVGMIAGTRMPHIEDSLTGFEAGAKYINPDIEVLTGFTETMTDVARGKEMATAFIEQGADVVCANANQTGLGVIDAAVSEGVLAIGYISDQYEVAPETIPVSAIQSVEFMVSSIIQRAVDGTLAPELYLLGAADGAIYLSDFHGHEDAFGEGGAEQLEEIFAGLQDGSLQEEGVVPVSVFAATQTSDAEMVEEDASETAESEMAESAAASSEAA